jgi:hypothetical protein
MLEISIEDIYLLLDLLSSEPERIFGVNGNGDIKFDLEKLTITGGFKHSRMDVLSKALDLPVSQLQSIWCLWMYNLGLIRRGADSFYPLAKEIVSVDPMFFDILMKAEENNDQEETKHMIKVFIKNQLKNNLDTQYFSVNKELLQDFYFDLSEEAQKKYQKYFKSPFSQYALLDSPINQFIKLWLQIFDTIEARDLQSFSKNFKEDKEIIKEFFYFYKYMKGSLDYSLPSMYFLWDGLDVDLPSKIDNKKVASDKTFFLLQLLMTFTGVKLTEVLSRIRKEDELESEEIRNFVDKLKQFVEEPLELDGLNEDIKDLIPVLFHVRFFNEIANLLFKNKLFQYQSSEICPSILGIMMGLAIENSQLTTTSVLNLVESCFDINKDLLRGLVSFILKNPSEETCLNLIFKELGICKKTGINLLELANSDIHREKYNAALNISREIWGNSKLVASVVAVFKKDISYCRIIANALDLNIEDFTVLVALATKRLDLVKDKLPNLSKNLNINNDHALESILNIAWGNYSQITNHEQNKFKALTNDQSELLEALLLLQQIGTRRRKREIKIDYKRVGWCCEVINRELCKILYPRNHNFELNTIDAMDVHLKINNLSSSSSSRNSENVQNFEIMDSKEEIKEHDSNLERMYTEEVKEDDTLVDAKKTRLLENIKIWVFSSLGDVNYQSQLAIMLNKHYNQKRKDTMGLKKMFKDEDCSLKGIFIVFNFLNVT